MPGMTKKQPNKLSDQLRRAIETSNIGQNELARRIGLDKSVLSRFLHGKSGLSIQTIDAIGEALGLRIVVEKRKAKRGGKED